MITRGKNQIVKANPKFAMLSSTARKTEPTSVAQAPKDDRWLASMNSEYNAQIHHRTWDLIPPDLSYNLIGTKWVFRIKRLPNGQIDKFKARFVSKGFHQRPGVDYEKTFSLVVKAATVHLVLGHAIDHGWDLRQLDISNAFLQGNLEEDVYIAQPSGFVDRERPHYVCKLRKALYGLKQAPGAWYLELQTFLTDSGFENSQSDASLFTLLHFGILVYVLVYVDDIVIMGNDSVVVEKFIQKLGNQFSLKDIGALSYFLSIEAHRSANGLLLT